MFETAVSLSNWRIHTLLIETFHFGEGDKFDDNNVKQISYSVLAKRAQSEICANCHTKYEIFWFHLTLQTLRENWPLENDHTNLERNLLEKNCNQNAMN